VGTGPQQMKLHLAFAVDLPDLLASPARLRAANVTPFDFAGSATEEPVVLAWMPAASIFFQDRDGHQLEFLSMLPDPPQPELGVVAWSRWLRRHDPVATPI
jgi:lactoylglutathione lyase